MIDRASPTDRAFLAMDDARAPEQFGVVLLFDEADGFDLDRARQVLADRVVAVPRLRQRLIRTPLGCGGPIWVDDERFDIRDQVRVVRCAEPWDERALLDRAYSLVATPLPLPGPRWSAVFVTGLADRQVALVIVLHHVLADGVGGLAILARLADPGTSAPPVVFPRPRPTATALALDAVSERVRAVLRTGAALRLLRMSTAAAGGLHPPRAVPCSLLRQTGGRGGSAVVRVPAKALRAAAHRHGATANDAILTAVGAALNDVLLASGESLDTVMVGVPVSGHVSEEPARGNMVSPLLVPVPATGDLAERLRRTEARVRAHKSSAQGPPLIALLGWLFRPLAALGVYRWYMNHQRRMHTLVSHVRGPADPITFSGWPIRSAVPIGSLGAGNVTVYFDVFTYAGTVTITVIADLDRFPDLDVLTRAVRAELDRITSLD
ncbi:wax ester/triacylglycerol synthase domain-containing protein [Lentzea nigeriaca]|uniref:wax ester/triacylglycerol synthase domain-containing protein n=1 Tax=Lentzea nigeriaca TaxID=1128665 RepID=UPI00195E9AF6|nr:wax ester/triacylglycerol synthase domain-containing protein [Lentzea nigeriaca]MBM7863735.1 WS/DGAT/MGAT family acyltransferase [Lentzea nigeriaca]